jgi:two-component system sensor histidine kinase BaeS
VARDVPLRRSLLLRLLVLSAVVLVCSITATAWLTVRTTAVAIRQEQGQTLNDDARVYSTLLGYAATHRSWSGVGPTLDRLARGSGHRITLTTESRQPVASTGATTSTALPARALATIDPLAVNAALASATGPASQSGLLPSARSSPAPCAADAPCAPSQLEADSGPDRIDPRAVGPFRLTGAEQRTLQLAARRSAACLQEQYHVTARITGSPSGRPQLVAPYVDLSALTGCASAVLTQPTATEARALRHLNALVNICLAGRGAPGVNLLLNFAWTQTTARSPASDQLVGSCIASSRSEQLGPYVAPPVLLFLSNSGQSAATFLDLSFANRARIAGVAAFILIITMVVTTLAGMRIIRPLQALARAARRMTDGDLSARVPVRAGDEVGRVGAAFNAMSAQLEQADDQRKALMSDVAHELRTPLSNIRGWLEAAQDGLVTLDGRLVSPLLGEAVLLQHVIDDLRDLSAADAGELRLHPERIDAGSLIEQVAAAHRVTAAAASVTVSVGAGHQELTADPVRLRQAVGNLVSNAIRHTPPGGTVTLRARRDGGDVVIDVLDTGTGISAADLPRLFDRFWRADKSRSRQTGGSGLGLAIVRKLAELHGGTVSAQSNPAGGSVFTIRLPDRTAPAGARAPGVSG